MSNNRLKMMKRMFATNIVSKKDPIERVMNAIKRKFPLNFCSGSLVFLVLIAKMSPVISAYDTPIK